MRKSVAKDVAVFGMLAAIMFVSKKLMEGLPNIHLVGVFITAITVVYRRKALFPLYAYVMLDGFFGGFNLWWLPYLYIWTLLWGAVMLLPEDLPRKAAPFIYGGICGLHGLLFGVLYAPAQALFFGLSLKGTLAWIASGFPFDCIHGASNLVLGTVLTVPLIRIMKKFR
ncbi:MAG: hypothetical protein CW338_06540 [Clostridiales bacterium]|nr:hypothetical protein [Clostridiales bacterium]